MYLHDIKLVSLLLAEVLKYSKINDAKFSFRLVRYMWFESHNHIREALEKKANDKCRNIKQAASCTSLNVGRLPVGDISYFPR